MYGMYDLDYERLALRALDMLDDQRYIDCLRPVLMDALPKDFPDVIEESLWIAVDMCLDGSSGCDPVEEIATQI